MSQKISIIIPVFNEEEYLPILLDSIIKQTQMPNEIVICDNNSTDNSVNVAKLYQDKLPIKIIHQSKKGILPTVEKAWRCAIGDLIIKTDADAVLPPEYVKVAANHLNSNPKTAAATGPIKSAENIFSMNLIMFVSSIGNFMLKVFRGYPIVLGPNGVFRRQVLVEVNGYISNKPTIDDQLISNKLFKSNHKIDYVFTLWNYHSTRRWIGKPIALMISFLSLFNSKYYQEKKK